MNSLLRFDTDKNLSIIFRTRIYGYFKKKSVFIRENPGPIFILGKKMFNPEQPGSGGQGQPAPGPGMTPNCCIMAMLSVRPQCSTNLPLVMRRMSIAPNDTFLPVAGIPINSP